MTLVLEACAVFLVGMLPFILSAFPNHYPEANQHLSNPELLISHWMRAGAVAAVVLYIAAHQPGGAASLGLYAGNGDRNAFDAFIGIVLVACCVLMIVMATRLFRRWTGKPPANSAGVNRPAIHDITRYRRFWERLSCVFVLIFLVVAEDLVSRGYLVYLLGHRLNNYLPAILISVIFTIVCHLYQGFTARTIITHTLFAAVFITLLLVTGNLLAVIAGHLYYDLLWAIGRWRAFDRQAADKTKQTYMCGDKVFYTLFVITNICVIAGFVILAGLRPGL